MAAIGSALKGALKGVKRFGKQPGRLLKAVKRQRQVVKGSRALGAPPKRRMMLTRHAGMLKKVRNRGLKKAGATAGIGAALGTSAYLKTRK